jgi:hypothetical protein
VIYLLIKLILLVEVSSIFFQHMIVIIIFLYFIT